MIIKKDDNLAVLMRKFLKDYNTQNCSMIVLKTCFDHMEKTVSFVFSENIESIVAKCEDVDFTASINGSFFITAILSELDRFGEVRVCRPDPEKNDITVNSIKFDECEFESKTFPNVETDISFTKEEFDKLGNDFTCTTGNWFVSPKTTDVIGFYVYEGALHKVLPGISVYKIGKFEASVNAVGLEQRYGHSASTWLLPRPVYDIFAGDAVKIALNSEGMVLTNNWLALSYSTPEMSTNAFKKKINAARNATADNVPKSPMKPYKAIDFSVFMKAGFESEEDRNVKIYKDAETNKNPGEMTVIIDDAKFNAVFEGANESIPLNTNLSSLAFILGQVSDDAQIAEANTETDSVYVIIDGDEFIFIPHVREIGY